MASYQSKEEASLMIMDNELRKKRWEEMLPDTKKNIKLVQMSAGSVRKRLILETFSLFELLRNELAETVYLSLLRTRCW